jgi:pre-mRNA-processing factor 40
MCRRHPEIKHYTRWKTARPTLQDETDFKAAKDEDERRELFEEFRVEALKEYEDKEYAERKSAMAEFRKILESLELDPYARWRPTKEIFDRKIRDENRLDELSAMKEVDYLTVFEDYVKELEKKFNDVQQAEKDAKYRVERKNRDAFNVRLLRSY